MSHPRINKIDPRAKNVRSFYLLEATSSKNIKTWFDTSLDAEYVIRRLRTGNYDMDDEDEVYRQFVNSLTNMKAFTLSRKVVRVPLNRANMMKALRGAPLEDIDVPKEEIQHFLCGRVFGLDRYRIRSLSEEMFKKVTAVAMMGVEFDNADWASVSKAAMQEEANLAAIILDMDRQEIGADDENEELTTTSDDDDDMFADE